MKPRIGGFVSLADQTCPGCEGDVPKMEPDEIEFFASEIPLWTVDGDKIFRDFEFKAFQPALEFVNRVGALAEAEGHHPDVLLHRYRHVRVTLYTHFVEGLTMNDFILAAKVDRA